jgi:hypothetical protein
VLQIRAFKAVTKEGLALVSGRTKDSKKEGKMSIDIRTANDLTRGQESAVLIKIAEQTGIENIEDAVKTFLRGTVEIVVKKILDMVGTTTTSATTEKFVAQEKFCKDSKEVKFYGIWDNFTEWFLAGNGKIEEPLSEQELRYGNLTKGSVDGPIIEELGGEAKAVATLTELYDLLTKQANGEDGVLLTNGYANIFYIKDISGVLRAVGVDWTGDGWGASANFVENPCVWSAGYRVFSRNS